jgi:ATP-dependent Clp protease adapter protein ClpS
MKTLKLINSLFAAEETTAVPTITPAEVEDNIGTTGDGFRSILYNDDHHSQEEVVLQIQKATGYSELMAEAIMYEAHFRGRAICFRGSRDECNKVCRILREIRLQCEVDCD